MGGSPDYVSLQPATVVGALGGGGSGSDTVTANDDSVHQQFDSTGMFHYCAPRPIEDCLIVRDTGSSLGLQHGGVC